MESVEVKFRVEYFVDEDTEEKCRAKVRLELPLEEGENGIVRILRDVNEIIFGDELDYYWGHKDNNGNIVFMTEELSAETWEKLQEKVEKLIYETVEILKSVKEKNLMLHRTKPANQEFEFMI